MRATAVYCCVVPIWTDVVAGETTIDAGGSGSTVTVAVADAAELALLVAFTVTVFVVVTDGAVKNPVLLMVPADADQETLLFVDVLVTVAVNCCIPLEYNVVRAGETVTVTVGA